MKKMSVFFFFFFFWRGGGGGGGGSENFQFLDVKFSIYLDRHVFVLFIYGVWFGHYMFLFCPHYEKHAYSNILNILTTKK